MPKPSAKTLKSAPQETYKRPARPPIAEKKANGEGTVYFEKSTGMWVAAVAIGLRPNRRPIIKKQRANSRGEAKEILRKLQTEKATGNVVQSSILTVRDLTTSWFRLRDIRESTRIRSEQHLAYALDVIGDRKVQAIRSDDIIQLLNQLSQQTMSHGGTMARITLKQIRTHLWSIFEHALEKEIIKKNPVTRKSRIKDADAIAGRPLTAAQTRRLCQVGEALHQAGVLRLWPALYVALRTGMRRGEIFALTWEEIDFSRQVIQIRRNVTRDRKGYKIGNPKTKKATRDIPMHQSLPAFLQEHLCKQQQELQAARVQWTKKTHVFCTRAGKPINPDNMFRSLENLITWADPANLNVPQGKRSSWHGIRREDRPRLMPVISGGEALPTISPHDLRHTYATLMLMNNVPIEVVSKLLGHANVSITLEIYRKVFPSELDQTRQIDICQDTTGVTASKPPQGEATQLPAPNPSATGTKPIRIRVRVNPQTASATH